MNLAPNASTAKTTPEVGLLDERLPLALLTRQEVISVAFTALIIGAIFALFHFMGNTVESVNSRSAFVWMSARWKDRISYGGADYSHGPFIPLVSLALLWFRRRDILAAPRSTAWLGLLLIFGALLLHWMGAKMQQTRLSLFALIGLLWAIPYHLFGWKFARHLLFPVAFLIFCVPLTFLDTISFPLRIFATQTAVGFSNGIGVQVVRNGTAIFSAVPGLYKFDVADPCSGLRSLLAMTALTAVYANVMMRGQWRKWVLFSASVPLAVAGNIARIIALILVAEVAGEDIASSIVHDYSGYVVFAVAIVLMIGIGSLLNTNLETLRAKFRAVLRPATP